MTALDWRPGPRLRALKDADAALVHMGRVRDGAWRLRVRLWAGRPLETVRETAQEAADAIERMMEGGK